MLRPDERLRVRGALDSYVSRGAHKLLRALEVFEIDLKDRVCVDVGASTGGFTDVMLRAGARQVYSVDVGYNLLDYRLRSDARVVCMERTNARFLKPEDFPERPVVRRDGRVLHLAEDRSARGAVRACCPDGRFVALVKPQFEAPKEDVGEKGVVRDPAVHARVLRDDHRIRPDAGLAGERAGLFTHPRPGGQHRVSARPRGGERRGRSCPGMVSGRRSFESL